MVADTHQLSLADGGSHQPSVEYHVAAHPDHWSAPIEHSHSGVQVRHNNMHNMVMDYIVNSTMVAIATTANSTPTTVNSSGGHDGETNSPVASENQCQTFLFIIYVVIFGTMVVFGLIGNTLSFMVLQWEKHNYVATFLLQVMALADNLFLLTTGYTQIYSALVYFMGITEDRIGPYNMVYIWPLVHITQMGTVWITVLIAFNRYIAICKPFQAPKLCTITRVRLQVFAMTVCIILYNLPRFFEHTFSTMYEPALDKNVTIGVGTALKQENLYNIIYESLLYCLFVFLGPLVILIVLNACLIRELMRARQRLLERQLPASMTGEDQENNLTLVMIVIVLIFLICQTPGFLNQLLFYLLGEGDYACGKAYFYFYHISNLIISANSALNFVIYCIFRKQFRERLSAFCRRQRHALMMTDHYHCNGRTASVYSRSTNAGGAVPL